MLSIATLLAIPSCAENKLTVCIANRVYSRDLSTNHHPLSSHALNPQSWIEQSSK